MTIHQLSVFIENKTGTLVKVLNTLKEGGIQIIASTVSDTVEYGLYRIICNKPSQAYRLLRDNSISVTMNDVFALQIDNTPGQAAQLFDTFSKADINISYMYSFLLKGKGIIVFRTGDTDKAREVISLNKFHFISEENLNELA
ncbi:MAG: amino acid-binding protein [Bacteroidaceae bacterium]|nr:amino acid-binding protein [Bacteroidaceae bacterium]